MRPLARIRARTCCGEHGRHDKRHPWRPAPPGPRGGARSVAGVRLRCTTARKEGSEVSGNPFEVADDSPVYVISVAAQLSGLHPQTLRAYDRLGLVSPGRSSGRGRRYSLRDVLLLREVQRLSQQDSVNLSGIKQILELGAELDRARRMLAEMTAEIAQLRAELESTRAVAARLAGLVRNRAAGAQLVPVRNLGGSSVPAGPAPQQAPAAMSSPPASSPPASSAANSSAANSSAASEETIK
jgi:MerR family transcriptional regulator/heat shock protein HspR